MSLDDLSQATEPLQDFLANAGCLRPLKCIEDRDLLVQDILMFQVVHRVSGAFERFLSMTKQCFSLQTVFETVFGLILVHDNYPKPTASH